MSNEDLGFYLLVVPFGIMMWFAVVAIAYWSMPEIYKKLFKKDKDGNR